MSEQLSGAMIWGVRVALMTGAIALGRWTLQALGWKQPDFFASVGLGLLLYYALRLMVNGGHNNGLRRNYDTRLRIPGSRR
ncbi:MAG TPA: hypothetical protein P5195_04485 [Anaerolineae bacterium]|nr:hypothetical protein [Anaerolineae bacterium]